MTSRFPKLTLRAQIAASAGLVALVMVALAGAVIAIRIDHRDRDSVDVQLHARAERVLTDIDKLLADGNDSQRRDDGYGDLLDGSDSLVRLLDGDTVVAQRGAISDQRLAAPTADGFSTITVDSAPWRSYVMSAEGGIQVQVLQSLDPVNDRLTANTQLIALVTILAAALSGAAGWLAATTVLRPLQRLTIGAVAIANDPDPHHRLPEATTPTEIATLSTTLNGMLDRLGASAETTRRFAADVGHELRGPLTVTTTYLETLLAAKDLPSGARAATVAALEQQQRMVATLGALQILARVDAGAMPAPTEIEPGLLVEELVRLARHRHPDVTYTLTDSSDGATVSGWSDGLRIAIDNLLDNAALHGRPHGHVDATISTDDALVRISITDDGPGIPADQRAHLRRRFTRGPAATSPGTGLGLALVDQQSTVHGGNLELSDSPTGGLRVSLTLPVLRRRSPSD